MDPLRHLRKAFAGLRLSTAERSAMRDVLLARIRATAAAPRIPSPYAGVFMTLAFQRGASFLAVLVVLASGVSGVSLAAEGAVPGDAIYALKVNVNEPLYSLVAVTPAAKAAVATSRAERRLEEAEVLAARGSLDEEAVADLSERFHDSAEEASAHIETLSEDAPEKGIDASVELESVLSAHGRIIDDIIAARDGDTEDALAMLRVDIAEKKEEVAQEREEADPSREDSEEALADATHDAKAAVADLADLAEELPEEDALALDSRVALITQAIDEGRAKHEQGAYQDAVAEFARAKTAIKVGWRLLEAKDRFETEEEIAAPAEEVAVEDAAVPEATTMAEPMMLKAAATTSATSTATSSGEAAPPARQAKRFWSGPRPIRIDLAP